MTAATVTCVIVPDTRATWRWAEALGVQYPDVLVVDVPPLKAPTLADVADAALVGLHKDERLSYMRREASPLVNAWLSLGEHADAVVVDAGAWPDELVDETLVWLGAHGINAWLMFATGPDTDHAALGEQIDELAERWHAQIVDQAALRDRWPARRRPRAEPAGPLPVLPRVDGCVFRAAIRDTLTAEEFDLVDARLVTLVRELRDEVVGLFGDNKKRKFEQLLRSRMHDTGDVEELHLLVRAAQIAGLSTGYLVNVNPVTFFGGCRALPRRGEGVDKRWWVKLDAYRDPDVGAVAAFYLAGLDLPVIADLTVADVDDTSGTVTVTVGDSPVPTPAPGARFVRALVAWRRLSGAGEGHRLFKTHRPLTAGPGVSPRHIASLLYQPGEIGVRCSPQPIRLTQPSALQWLARYGISIVKLDYTPANP